MKMRPATDAEILTRYLAGDRVSFDAYVVEHWDRHDNRRLVRRGSSKVRDINGVPHVRRRGRMERLYATHCDTGNCTFVSLLTIVAPRTGTAA